jgi:hypothetical protein
MGMCPQAGWGVRWPPRRPDEGAPELSPTPNFRRAAAMSANWPNDGAAAADSFVSITSTAGAQQSAGR